MSQGKMQWSDGMLYPVLHRLEKEELIRSEWVMAENARPRKYYHITEQGKQALLTERDQWLQVNSVLDEIWGIEPTS